MRTALVSGVLVLLGCSGLWAQYPDYNRSGMVDFEDFYAFVDVFGSRYGDPAYDLLYDLNADGAIGFDDFFSFAESFGQSVPPDYALSERHVHTQQPSYVNIMFQITDAAGRGVGHLRAADFLVGENDLAISPTSTALQIRKRDRFPYLLKTVLMLDNGLSAGNYLGEITSAAASLVENITTQQLIAVYAFSENAGLVHDFTADVDSLQTAISHLQLGYPSTDLHGSVITGVSQWDDVYTTSGVEEGILILLTDGADTRASSTLSQALSARGDKRVIAIGLGDDVDGETLRQLGNAGYFQLDDPSQLAPLLRAIQRDIVSRADGLYWLFYMSPARGDETHSLELAVAGNTSASTVSSAISSADFYAVNRGVYIDPTEGNKTGTKRLCIAPGDTILAQAVTYLGPNPPQYDWISEDEDAVVVVAGGEGRATARVIAVGDSGQTATIEVEDLANNYIRSLSIELVATTRFPLLGGATMDFVWIVPGAFTMGASDIATPQHEVTISRGYWLGKYEITQAQWEAVMGSNPSTYSGADLPVENVSWNEVEEFIRRLNEVAGEGVYRLPTEAEWEYACRAGTSTRWSFGDSDGQLGEYAWFSGNSRPLATRDTGSKLENPWRVHDLHGNVAEWVQDWFESYAAQDLVDPTGPATGTLRVVRGGSFSHSAPYTRSAARLHLAPTYHFKNVGARLLRTR